MFWPSNPSTTQTQPMSIQTDVGTVVADRVSSTLQPRTERQCLVFQRSAELRDEVEFLAGKFLAPAAGGWTWKFEPAGRRAAPSRVHFDKGGSARPHPACGIGYTDAETASRYAHFTETKVTAAPDEVTCKSCRRTNAFSAEKVNR